MGTEKIDLSIIIVNYNVKDLVIKNISSIFLYTKNINYKIYLVDNGSNDNSCIEIKEKFKNEIENNLLVLYDTKTNNGFSKGNNIPFNDINSRYILYMNPDMEIKENSLYKMVEFMDKNESADISSCMLKYPDDEIQHNIKNLPTFSVNLLMLLKLHNFFPNINTFKNYFLQDFDYTKEYKVNQIMGAFTLIRYDVMKKIGGWDEKYFLWWEDVDLYKKANDLGLNIIYTPITYVTHYEGKSFFQLNTIERQKRFNKGMLIYSRKYFPYYQYLILKVISYLSLLLAYITQLLKVAPRGQGRI